MFNFSRFVYKFYLFGWVQDTVATGGNHYFTNNMFKQKFRDVVFEVYVVGIKRGAKNLKCLDIESVMDRYTFEMINSKFLLLVAERYGNIKEIKIKELKRIYDENIKNICRAIIFSDIDKNRLINILCEMNS